MLQRSTTLTLKLFCSSHALKPLAKDEERIVLEGPAVHPRLLVEGQRLRLCIRNKTTGAVSLERKCEAKRNRLHLVSDRGPTIWPGWFFLFGPGQCIGSFKWDEAHKGWDDPQHTINRIGMGSFFLWCIVLSVNFMHAPFNTAAFMVSLSNCADKYFAHMDPSCATFQFYYTHMSKQAIESPALVGTDESIRRVWDCFKSCPLYREKGSKTKMTRWFSIFDRLEEFIPWWWALAAMIAILSFPQGCLRRLC